MKKMLLYFALMLSLQAVASPPEAPSAQAESRVLVRSDLPDGLWHFRTYEDGESCKGLSPPMREAKWVPAKAGQTFTVLFGGASSNDAFRYKYCRANVSFTPVGGKSYVANFKLGDAHCEYRVVEVTESEDRVMGPVEFAVREYKAPFLQSGSWCGKPMRK